MSSFSIEAFRDDLIDVIEQTISTRENVILKSLSQFQDNILQELLSLKLLLYKHCSNSNSSEFDSYNHAASKIRNAALGLLSKDTGANIFQDLSKKKESEKYSSSEFKDEEKYIDWPSSQVFQKDVPSTPLVKAILHTKATDSFYSEAKNECSSSQFLDSIGLNNDDQNSSPVVDLNDEEDFEHNSNLANEFQGEFSEDVGEPLLDTSSEKVKISPENIKDYYVILSDKGHSEDEVGSTKETVHAVPAPLSRVAKPYSNNSENPESYGFRCGYCDVVFEDSEMLEIHLTTHLRKREKKRCKCLLCGIICSSRSTMHKHLRRHNGDKPFSCTICGRAFNLKYSLKRHLMTHTGEKPFKCSVCDKAFARKDRRDVHTKVNHPNLFNPGTAKSITSLAHTYGEKSVEEVQN